MSIQDHLLDLNATSNNPPTQEQWVHRAPRPLPAPKQLQHLGSAEAAIQVLSYLSARPSHSGHVALSAASCCSTATDLAEIKVCLELDLLELMEISPALARTLVTDTEAVRLALMDLLHADGVLKLRFPRLWVKLIKVPVVPESSISGMMGRFAAWSCDHVAARSTQPTGASWLGSSPQGPMDVPPQLVHFTGVICAVSTPWIKKYSQTWCCGRCGSERQELGGHFSLQEDAAEAPQCPACPAALAADGGLQEDLSQRIMVPAQDIWVRDLSSALGSCGAFAVSQSSMLVRVTDELPPPGAPGLRVGDTVQVVGPARFMLLAAAGDAKSGGYSGGGGQVARAAGQVEVSPPHQLSAVDPFLSWTPGALGGPAVLQQLGDPGNERGDAEEPTLQDLCHLLMEALGHDAPYPLCLALLVSAVSVARPPRDSSPEQQQAALAGGKRSYQARPLQQLSILFVEEAQGSLLLPRILRPAAHILCPHSTFLGVHMEDMMTPRLQSYARADQDGQDVQVIHSSVLTSANCGILVLDCLLLDSPRLKLQLTEALARGHIVLSTPATAARKANGAGGLMVPVTATVWAVTADLQPKAGLEGCEAGGPSGQGARSRGQKAPGRAMRDDGFNLVLRYTMADEDELVVHGMHSMHSTGDNQHAALSEQGVAQQRAGTIIGSGGEEEERRLHATQMLRQRLGAARRRPSQPQFTGDGLALLQRYVVSVRQSAVGRHVPHAQIVASLVAASRGAAALLGRAAVRSHPECVVAILLVESSLCTRFGKAYYNSCMPSMELAPDASLEEQLFALYQILDMQLKEVVPTVSSAPGDWPSTVTG